MWLFCIDFNKETQHCNCINAVFQLCFLRCFVKTMSCEISFKCFEVAYSTLCQIYKESNVQILTPIPRLCRTDVAELNTEKDETNKIYLVTSTKFYLPRRPFSLQSLLLFLPKIRGARAPWTLPLDPPLLYITKQAPAPESSGAGTRVVIL